MKHCTFCGSLIMFQFQYIQQTNCICKTKPTTYEMEIITKMKKNERNIVRDKGVRVAEEKHFLKTNTGNCQKHIGFPLTAYRRWKAMGHETSGNAR